IAFDTGIDRETIADWVTGKRQMSQLVKAMLFFYLK
ncbi:MAG: XRE family transcriptional regulator, partial [Pedobacter sp.]